jgi:hypothetical protein
MKLDSRASLGRILSVFAAVFLTYNPSGYSYIHWLASGAGGPLPLKIAVGIFLLIVFYVLITVTYSAFRLTGVIVGSITALMFSAQAVIFGLPESGIETFGDLIAFATYVVLMTLAIVMGFGITWSKFVSGLTGQSAKRYIRRAN